MVMKKLNLRLFRLIRDSKGQVIAVISVIVIGLMIYTALSMASFNLQDSVEYFYDLTNFADMYVQVIKIPGSQIEKVKGYKGISDAQGRVVMDVPIKVSDDERVNVRVISLPEAKERINSLYLVEGEDLKKSSKDVLVIQQFADARGIKIGDVINLVIGGREYQLKVKGIVASPEYVYVMENEQTLLPQPEKFGVVFVSDAFARESFGLGDSYNEIIIKVEDEREIDKIKDVLEDELERYGVKRIIKKDDQLSNRMVHEELMGLEKSTSTVPVIFLSIASFILGIMISRMVSRDRASIGVLKALGYSNLQIISHYTKFSLFIGIIGSLVGSLLGLISSGLLTTLYIQFFNLPLMRINFYYRYVVLAVVLAGVFCTGAGLLGGRKILKIYPAESMRPEVPKGGKRIFLERVKFIWNKISFTWKIVIRNTLRSKRRFIILCLGIALTYGMVLVTLQLFSGVDTLFTSHYDEFQRMDYNINFSKPMNRKVLIDLKNIIEVERIEPKIEYPFELVYGWKSKVVNVIGVERDTKFYSFKDLNNINILIPEDGIVLSENLADYLGVKKGDLIKVKSYIPDRKDVDLAVKDIIKQGLGINAYMEINYMGRILLDEGLITGAYFDTKMDPREKIEELKNVSSLQSMEDMINTFKKFMGLMITSFSMLLIFSGVLGFAIVYNATIMSISERTLEFSSLRVMGFTKYEIFNIIVRENYITTIVGIILGIPLGRGMVKGVGNAFSSDLYTFDFPMETRIYVYSAIATLIFVSWAQLATFRKISRLEFMEALKSRIP